MKTRQDNDVIDLIDLVYSENEIEFSRPIEQWSYRSSLWWNQIGQWCYQSSTYGLHKNKTEMSWSIKLGTVYHETRQNNDIIDHTSVVYIENDTEMSWLIGPSIVCNEN